MEITELISNKVVEGLGVAGNGGGITMPLELKPNEIQRGERKGFKVLLH